MPTIFDDGNNWRRMPEEMRVLFATYNVQSRTSTLRAHAWMHGVMIYFNTQKRSMQNGPLRNEVQLPKKEQIGRAKNSDVDGLSMPAFIFFAVNTETSAVYFH